MPARRYTKGRALVGQGFMPTVRRVHLVANGLDSEQDTGYDLPPKAILRNVYLDVTTVEATGGTKTIDIGLLASETGGDANGFLAAVSCSGTAGLRQGTVSTGTATLGALLKEDVQGSAGSTGNTEVPEPFLTDEVAAESLSYTFGSTGWVEFVGDLYLEFIQI
jgi:hypothetical protein